MVRAVKPLVMVTNTAEGCSAESMVGGDGIVGTILRADGIDHVILGFGLPLAEHGIVTVSPIHNKRG